MKHLFLAPFILGFISPVLADSWKDIDDLKNLIESNGTEIKELNNCEENNLGHYSPNSKDNDVLTICTNNINNQDPSEYWEVLAHEAAHAMQACNNNTLWQSKYHPRMLRGLKSEAPHYAEILKQYRGRDKILELEAFDMELQTPSEVKYNYKYYCLNNQNDELVENPVLTDENISLLYDLVGGEDAYDELVTWGIRNYSEDEIKKFDEVIDNGTFEDIKKSILNLNERYIQSNSEVKDLSAENNQEGLTDDQVKILKNLVGGEKSYDKFVDWAINNLNEKEKFEYDQLVDSGDFEKIKSKMLYYFSKFEDTQNQNILTSKQIEDLQDSVGGSKKYDELMAWSRENLSIKEATKFDEIISRQDYQEIKETLSQLKIKYENWILQFNFLKIEPFKPFPESLNNDPDVRVIETKNLKEACDVAYKIYPEMKNLKPVLRKIDETKNIENLYSLSSNEKNIVNKYVKLIKRSRASENEIFRHSGISDWRTYSSFDKYGAANLYNGREKINTNDPNYKYILNDLILGFDVERSETIEHLCSRGNYFEMLNYHAKKSNEEKKDSIKKTIKTGSFKSRNSLLRELWKDFNIFLVKDDFKNHNYPLLVKENKIFYLECNVEGYETIQRGKKVETKKIIPLFPGMTALTDNYFGDFGEVVEKIDLKNKRWSRIFFNENKGFAVETKIGEADYESKILTYFLKEKPWYLKDDESGYSGIKYRVNVKDGTLTGDGLRILNFKKNDKNQTDSLYNGKCFNARDKSIRLINKLLK